MSPGNAIGRRRGRAAAVIPGILSAGVLAAVMAVFVTCESQDPLAPEGSTIKVRANPQTIVIPPGSSGAVGTSEITATLRGKDGVRLPDQEIAFSTNKGTLTPLSDLIQLTDQNGEATITLETSTSATVTADSGSVTGNTTVQVATGNVSDLFLELVDPTDVSLSACDEQVELIVTAEDPNGVGVGGVAITLRAVEKPASFDRKLKGTFDFPSGNRTDALGGLSATFIPDASDCTNNCVDPNNPIECGVEIFADATSQGISSQGLEVSEALD